MTFQSTVDDFVEIMTRSRRSHNTAYYQSLFLSAVGAGAIFGIPIYLIAQAWPPAVIAFVAASSGFLIYNYGRERELRNDLIKRFQRAEPRWVTVEITPDGFTFTYRVGKQIETIFKTWDKVEAIEETTDAIYFKRKGARSGAVRRRGFTSDEDMEEFLKLANQYRDAALAND